MATESSEQAAPAGSPARLNELFLQSDAAIQRKRYSARSRVIISVATHANMFEPYTWLGW